MIDKSRPPTFFMKCIHARFLLKVSFLFPGSESRLGKAMSTAKVSLGQFCGLLFPGFDDPDLVGCTELQTVKILVSPNTIHIFFFTRPQAIHDNVAPTFGILTAHKQINGSIIQKVTRWRTPILAGE
jgi:hypothetical protein